MSATLLNEHPLSSCAQKARIALREKALDCQVEAPAASAKNDIRFTWPLG